MKKFLILLMAGLIFLGGCSSIPRDERIRQKLKESGTLFEKVKYLSDNYSSKRTVVDILGYPSRKQDFHAGSSIWYYDETKESLELIFGLDGRLLRIATANDEDY